ncbi:MAG: hypothetical protein V8R63_03030 [Thomasclavelia ramosa]
MKVINITVADEVHCINTYNNRGVFDGVQRHYMIGDFVYYKGYWWQLITKKIIMVSVQNRIENKNGKKLIKITIDLVHIQLMM